MTISWTEEENFEYLTVSTQPRQKGAYSQVIRLLEPIQIPYLYNALVGISVEGQYFVCQVVMSSLDSADYIAPVHISIAMSWIESAK